MNAYKTPLVINSCNHLSNVFSWHATARHVLRWCYFSNNTTERSYAWLPILFWISMPLVSWSHTNNILENTITIFCVFSIYFISRGLYQQRYSFILSGTVLIYLAFLSKGLVGLFLIALPLVYQYINKPPVSNYWKMIGLILLSFSILIALTYWTWPESRLWLTNYYNYQLYPAIMKRGELTTAYHLSIFFGIIKQMIILFLLSLLLIWTTDKKMKLPNIKNKRIHYFLLIGLSASIPLMITLKQREFYLLPALPFYALAISFYILGIIKNLVNKISDHQIKIIRTIAYGITLISVSLGVYKTDTFSRDEALLSDLKTICEYLPKGTTVSVSNELCTDWRLMAYLSRIGDISINCNSAEKYNLSSKKNSLQAKDTHLRIDTIDLSMFNLDKYR